MTQERPRQIGLPDDLLAFSEGLKRIREELGDPGEADFEHLQKIERWGRTATAIGLATAPLGPNPLSIAALSLGRTTRWTMMAHHVLHKGYDKTPGIPERYTSKGFAKGKRRWLDWFDWIVPEAWQHEHNVLHHYRLGEETDPDLVEHNLDWLRKKPWPRPVKLALIGVLAAMWKSAYYAPNTLMELEYAQARRQGQDGAVTFSDGQVLNPATPLGRKLWTKSWLPYAGWHFGVLPALYAPLGPIAVANVAINSLLAELVTNLHTFTIITTNHAGDDMCRFEGKVSSKAHWQLRQVLGSVNFRTGGDVNDFLHGWLNYQIEHHVWPDLSMLQYQQVQPAVKALCEAHSVPYAQENVFMRLKKTLAIMTGHASMAHGP